MKILVLGLGAALWALGCTDPIEISDYDAGAVIKGVARFSTGEPVVGAAVQVAVHRSECEQQPILTSGGSVSTGADGDFEGDFSFLSAGPVVAECVRVHLVDTLTSTLVGDTLIPTALRFDVMRSDTLEVELEF